MRLTALLFIFFAISTVAIDFKDELVDWSLIALSSAGAYTFSQTGPFFDEAFVDVATDKPYREDRLSGLGFYSASFAVSSAVFAPRSESHNRISKYIHFKGFVLSATSTSMLTGMIKDFAGSPRPHADAAFLRGIEERHIRDSFPSGHASFAFCNATYSSLYLWNYWGDNRRDYTLLKTASSAGLFTAATAIAYSRVDNFQHRTSDILAGAFLGSATALGIFILQEKRIESNNNRVHLETTPNGAFLVWRF